MIKKIERNYGQQYYNIFELILLFIVNEIYIIGEFLGIYDAQEQKVNTRRLFWWIVAFCIIAVFMISVISSSVFICLHFLNFV